MLPEPLLSLAHNAGVFYPRYLQPGDIAWVRRMLDLLAASVGARRADVEGRLLETHYRESDVARRGMLRVLLEGARFGIAAEVEPREARRRAFTGRADSPSTSRAELFTALAAELSTTAAALEDALYADLHDEQILLQGPDGDAQAAIHRYNLALLKGLVACSVELRIVGGSELCSVLRTTKLHRLLCEIQRRDGGSVEIILSGALSVLRHTRKYGRALGACVPVLLRTPGWALRGVAVIRGRRGSFTASAEDPVGVAPNEVRFDSKVEERLYRDLLAATRWRVEREPEPLEAGGRLIFPDFGITPPSGRRVLVEVVGFWTPEYLRAKLAALRGVGSVALVLCINEDLCLGDEVLPDLPVVPYRRRIDVTALLRAVEIAART